MSQSVAARVALLAASALIAACGRKATAEDCQLILDRSVELQMKEMRDAEANAIASRQEVLRLELAADIKEHCTGRHMTDATMNCVREAATPDQLEECIR